jgi:hypothetical protein
MPSTSTLRTGPASPTVLEAPALLVFRTLSSPRCGLAAAPSIARIVLARIGCSQIEEGGPLRTPSTPNR